MTRRCPWCNRTLSEYRLVPPLVVSPGLMLLTQASLVAVEEVALVHDGVAAP